jgi:sugar phosphate isomerase/epimerase
MQYNPFVDRLAVCSWSLQPESPQQLVEQLKTIGLARVQLALDPLRTQPERWGRCAELFSKHGIQIVSGMFGTVGEDYSTLESIRRTGGLVPDATWDENWRNIQAIAGLAQGLGLRLVTFHAGFLPHDERDPDFVKLLARIRTVADLFAAKGIDLGFETGQETAATLRAFLQKLAQPTVGVNFDPANMILYDKGNPIDALKVLSPWLKQCHIKDANRTQTPGTWGEEVPAGTGQVDWPTFFRVLLGSQFKGYLAIEREAGTQRIQDIATAKKLVESIAL